MDITLNPTLSGGTVVALNRVQNNGNTVTWVGPDGSRLNPHTFTESNAVIPAGKKGSGLFRAGLKGEMFFPLTVEEGCCTTDQVPLHFDLGVRTDNRLTSAQLDAGIAYLRALVNSTGFATLVKQGRLPAD